MSASVNVTNDPVAATENGNIVALINHAVSKCKMFCSVKTEIQCFNLF